MTGRGTFELFGGGQPRKQKGAAARPRDDAWSSTPDFTAFSAVPFFLPAEDGIRAGTVTGVQTCALPIFTAATDSGATTGTSTFGYDTAGNTTARSLPGKPGQTLTWDAEGHLASLADSTGTLEQN